MDWLFIIKHSLFYGIVLSTILTLLIMISLKINPEIWLQDYPPDVKVKWGPMSKKARRQRAILGIPLAGSIIITLFFSVWSLYKIFGHEPTFIAIFISSGLIILVFNLVDALIIDWFFLMIIWPNLVVLPGTEGMAGYTDLNFQIKNFLKGCVFSIIFGLIVATISKIIIWTVSNI